MKRKRQSGFGLAEILVGLAIGLITALVVMQVGTSFEGQKRTTSGVADAQTNGGIALYTIQRQAQMAGYGLPVFSHQNQPLYCDPATLGTDIFPISVVDGGGDAGASDAITIRGSGSSINSAPMGGIPITVSGVAGNDVTMDNNLACAVNDVVIVSNGSSCVMTKVAAMTEDETQQITLQSAADVSMGASLACIGQWTETTYEVTNGTLMTNGAASAAGIVNIQAQYGISTSANDNQVSAWVDPSGETWGATATTPTIANRNRIKAIRIAVVARSNLLEKSDVTEACSSLTAAAPTGLCAWEGSADNPAPKIDLSKNADGSANPDWKKYRYRVFETIIPLRNMIWSYDTLS